MFKITQVILATFLFMAAMSCSLQAGLFSWSQSPLVTIDGENYSAQDYKSWWENWREEGMSLPESPDSYIDWLLLYREAERMNFAGDPAFNRKVLTFLKARTLLMLKYDEVDSKIDITAEKMWQRYTESYVPLWLVNVILFHTKEEADTAYSKLITGAVTVEELDKRNMQEGGALSVTSKYQRPINTHAEWQRILTETGNSGFSQPVPFSNGYVVLHLLTTKGAGREDFNVVSTEIRRKLWKEEQGRLTVELLDTLNKQYEVRIDRTRLEALDINAPDSVFTDKAIVTFRDGDVSEKEFMGILRKQQKFRGDLGFDDTNFKYKEQVLAGIISQTLTTMESLARHYEKKPPFESVYEFYVRHRLGKMLEKQVFFTGAVVSDEEVQAYYKENTDEFKHPGEYRVILIEGSEEDMQTAWKHVLVGDDFRELVKKSSSHGEGVRIFTEDVMDPGLKKAVSGLNKNEISEVVPYNGQYALVQLVDYKPATIFPLNMVRDRLEGQLKSKKADQLRSVYLKKLREKIIINVNYNVWQNLRAELDQDNEDKQK